ncbi:integral membrane protein [Niveomyces insectorum RCEF 264]|uniref:Integral membrane protein n=1 Tax=Niveomyces insectorum RCEF 264 TaxID=1081102 RepID=A0A162MR84_9HYPO|nr:integral membrane protein [Niveomyces insectorum RCEF 264]
MSTRSLGLPAAAAAGAAVLFFLAAPAAAHEHGEDHIPEGATISLDPIDATLWVHILLQTLVWGILFPIGMVLGIIRSRWHVPLQITASALAIVGYVLGHLHRGRQFVSHNVHASFAGTLMFMLAAQVTLGIYLRLHLERGLHGRIRPFARGLHGVLGKAFPVVAWTQMVFGGITTLGFCQGDHLGQCLAHFIMGGAFIAYGVLLTILLVVGQVWLRRTGRSPEFFDSCVIAAWGCVNTFTEHRWGTAWVKNDWQHTTMGIIWWSAGLAGVWLSRGRDGRPQRNFVPGFVILITGWAMSAHPQELMVSAATHTLFGYTLMAAGLTRIIEVAIVLRDQNGLAADGTETNSFQYIPVFLLYAAGFLFMGATEEQMQLVAGSSIDHVAYILILYSLAFLFFLFTHLLVSLYDRTANADLLAAKRQQYQASAVPGTTAPAARGVRLRSHDRTESRQLRDAEEFELGELMSDDEEGALGADDDDDDEQAARRNLLKPEGNGTEAGQHYGNGQAHP